MATIILLSSSPPQVFARSPTIVDSSPGLQSPGSILRNDGPRNKRFKSVTKQKNSLHADIGGIKHVLADKHEEVNKLVSSPGRNKFKSSQGEAVVGECGRESKAASTTPGKTPERQTEPIPTARNFPFAVSQEDQTNSKRHPSGSPLIVQRAVARRIDWTPPKPSVIHNDSGDGAAPCAPAFPSGLLEDFSFPSPVGNLASTIPERRAECQKMDPTISEAGSVLHRRPPITQPKQVTKRNKSPPKKALTITGLATSNFQGRDQSDGPSIVKYLESSQNHLLTPSITGDFDDKVKRTKAAAKKIKESKKSSAKSRLVSPQSAMKSFEEQEAVFGSASQLVGSNSNVPTKSVPTNSEDFDMFVHSDPLSSPACTQATSATAEASRQGILRYKKSRNLWSAAGRDEDNALLHDDVVDLTGTTDLRSLFAGKDVMIQSSTTKSGSSMAPPSKSRGLALTKTPLHSIVDIDDMSSPRQSPSLQRSFHTTTNAPSPRTRILAKPDATSNNDPTFSNAATSKTDKPPPKKPNYAGFTDQDLKKQIAAYGFKAMRKREKMIQLLEKCWQEKYGLDDATVQPTQVRSGYGDILSTVHDVSARAIPKVKKVSKPRKKKTDDNEEILRTKPRQRKKKSEDTHSEGKPAKPARKRKSKAAELSNERVYDIEEDLNDPAVLERREMEKVEDWARPPKKAKKKEVFVEATINPLTPPATLPELSKQPQEAPCIQNSTPLPPAEFVQINSDIPVANPTPPDTQQPKIDDQITRAINHQSFTANIHSSSQLLPPSSSAAAAAAAAVAAASHPCKERRNHQLNPTWHEKILLYDPIVLEDLASWLNTEGFKAIGEDREVGAVEVRTWCETRGVCCLWKGGWRGNRGTGGGSGGVVVVGEDD